MLFTGQVDSKTQITPEAYQELGSLSFLKPPAFRILPVLPHPQGLTSVMALGAAG